VTCERDAAKGAWKLAQREFDFAFDSLVAASTPTPHRKRAV
jgi:hypothetical protein